MDRDWLDLDALKQELGGFTHEFQLCLFADSEPPHTEPCVKVSMPQWALEHFIGEWRPSLYAKMAPPRQRIWVPKKTPEVDECMHAFEPTLYALPEPVSTSAGFTQALRSSWEERLMWCEVSEKTVRWADEFRPEFGFLLARDLDDLAGMLSELPRVPMDGFRKWRKATGWEIEEIERQEEFETWLMDFAGC